MIGKKMLNSPNKKKCPATTEVLRLYSVMCIHFLGGSSKHFQQAFPIGVAAFLSKIGISKHFESMNFMPCLILSDKMIDYCVLAHKQFVFCKVVD